jgi:hypothetical protein
MSNPRQNAIISRHYRNAPSCYAQALELLLKKPVRKMAAEPAPEPDGRDGTTVQGDDSADARIIPE